MVAPFFDELQIDIGGGAIAVIEVGAIDAEELEGLVEVGFGELGLQELGEVDRWGVAMLQSNAEVSYKMYGRN